MSDILTDSEMVDIERFQKQRRRQPVPEDAWLYVAEIDRLIASHRALAAERDNLKEVNQGIIDGIKDGKAIVSERIRALESACEAALRWFSNEPGFPRESQIVEQLEGAIKHG